MRCTICKKTSDEVRLYTGIFENGMVMVCEECAGQEGIPIVKKPSDSQLSKANKRYSVRERMERMSGVRDATEVSDDQLATQGNLAKLRIPPKKEHNDAVLYNYYWTLNIARRRAKLSIKQLAKKTGLSPDLIQSIEKGKIPENFEDIFIKLEMFLGIRLLKSHKRKINFVQKINNERDLIDNVRRKMEHPNEVKAEQLSKISNINSEFSKRENLSNVTIDDLVSIKKEQEKKKKSHERKIRKETLIGDDLDLDIDVL